MKRLFTFLAIFLIAGVLGVFAQETLPYGEDFADTAFPPTGWASYQLDSSTYNWERSTDGSGSAFHTDFNGSHSSWLVSPQIAIPAGAVATLSFMQKNHYMSYYDEHGVYISTGSGDPNDGEFVLLNEYPTSYASFTLTEEALTAYAGNNIYIAFVYTGVYASRWWVDDVLVEQAQDYDVALTQVTPNSNGAPGADLYYQLQVENKGGADDDYTFSLSKAWAVGIYADTSDTPLPSPFTVTAGNTADVYLKVSIPGSASHLDTSDEIVQVNGNGVSDSVTVTTTAFSTPTLPFSESFDAAGWPLGWGVVDPQGAIWSVNATANAGGTANEMVARWQSGTWTTRVETPAIDVVGVSAVNVSFKHFWNDYGAGITAKVIYSTNGIDWTDSGWEIISGGGDVGPETANIPISIPAKADELYVGWVTDGNHYQYDYWYIDDVAIAEAVSYDVALTQLSPDWMAEPGESLYYALLVENNGSNADDYTFSLSKAWAVGVYADTSDTPLPSPFQIAGYDSATVYLKVSVPGAAAYGDETVDAVQVSGTGVSDSVNITTTAVNVLFEEGFATEIPSTWAIYELGDTTLPAELWHWADGGNNDGYARHTWTTDGAAADNWLVSPGVYIDTAKAGNSIWLGFYELGPNPVADGFYEYHGVWLSNGDRDPALGGYVELSEIQPQGNVAGWQWYSLDLAAYAGETVYFAFRYTGMDMDAWLIDYSVIYNDGYSGGVQYDVTLLADPGDIGVVLNGAGSYDAGATVNISAELPPKGYVFVEWTGDYAYLLDNANMSATSFTMPEGNVILTANYEEVGDYVPAMLSIDSVGLEGIWRWQYTQAKGSVWQRVLETVTATKMMAGDITDDGNLDLIVRFADDTLYIYDINAATWGMLCGSTVGLLDFTLAQTSASGPLQLIVSNTTAGGNIDAGINYLEVGVGFQNIDPNSADVITGVDITNDGVDELVFAFTGIEGMYAYDFLADTTTKIAISSPSQVIAADVTGDGYDEAVALVPGLGVYLIRYIPDKNLVFQMSGKSPFDLVKDIDENSVWVSKNKSGKGLQFNRITWGTPDAGTEIASGDITLGIGAEVFIVYQNRTYYYCYDTTSWSTLLYVPLKRIISGKFTGREKDDLVTCDANSLDLYLYKSYTSSWERMMIAGNSNAMATVE